MIKNRIGGLITRHQNSPIVRAAASVAAQLHVKAALSQVLFKRKGAPRPEPALGEPVDPLERVLAQLERISRSGRPIVVGPWLSEVGFEILYWIPFLRWAMKAYKIPKERITVISRGGVRDWYDGIAHDYRDVFDIYTPDEFRQLNEERWQENAGLQKHRTVSSFDRRILERVVQFADFELLHPELMYLIFDDYWNGDAGNGRFIKHTRISGLQAPPAVANLALPETYVAVKFYGRPSFPIDDKTRRFVSEFTRKLADRTPVVFITTGLKADDHGEFEVPAHPNVIRLNEDLRPSNNLAIQSAIIAGASQVFCTYGGFAYLPLLYRVPTVGVYSVDKHFLKKHGCAAYQLAFNLKTPLSVMHISALR